MTDLRTPLQKARAERAERVCNMYLQLKAGNVCGSETAIIEHIASTISAEGEYLTPMGVRYILKAKNIYG